LELLLGVIFGSLIFSVSLLVASKITGVAVYYKSLLIIAIVVAVISLVPKFGFALSVIALFFLLKKATDLEFYPDLLLMVIVSVVLNFLINLGIEDIINRMI
jgi:hypothetical protein